MTPVKYECDANNLPGTVAGLKILLMEKLMNGALVTPTPGFIHVHVIECSSLTVDLERTHHVEHKESGLAGAGVYTSICI